MAAEYRNSRFEAYASAHGMTYEEMLGHWRDIYDGNKLYDHTVEPYSIWLTSQMIAWMESRQLGKVPGLDSVESRRHHLGAPGGNEAFDAWLLKYWPPVKEEHGHDA